MPVEERPGAASLRGNPFTVLGRELSPGDDAPDFSLVGPGMFEVTLKDSAGKVRLISCVPSLDTAVCSTETQKWERTRETMGDVDMLTVSMDLPYAQQRWCAANDAQHTIASAHKNEQFGIDYGVLIKELRILARAVFVVDREAKVRYAEYVSDFSNEPNYERAIAAVRHALRRR
jgi:thiol peroxidase